MKEIWKDIKGYEGKYQVSNLGKVRNNKTKKLLSGTANSGYIRVHLANAEGKKRYEQVHRLVATAFIPNPFGYTQVNHIDEVKQNNRVDNLEWCSAQYNNTYGTRIERAVTNNPQCVKVLCVETGIIYNTMSEAGRQTQVPQANISKVCRGERHTAGGFHWCYWKEEEDAKNKLKD